MGSIEIWLFSIIIFFRKKCCQLIEEIRVRRQSILELAHNIHIPSVEHFFRRGKRKHREKSIALCLGIKLKFKYFHALFYYTRTPKAGKGFHLPCSISLTIVNEMEHKIRTESIR